jgi:hypothetical protein
MASAMQTDRERERTCACCAAAAALPGTLKRQWCCWLRRQGSSQRPKGTERAHSFSLDYFLKQNFLKPFKSTLKFGFEISFEFRKNSDSTIQVMHQHECINMFLTLRWILIWQKLLFSYIPMPTQLHK